MHIVFDSKNFNTIIYTKRSCVPSFVINKPSVNNFKRESSKTLKKPQKRNLACKFKHMIIVLDSKHFNTIIYTKGYCVPYFVSKKLSSNHFMRESAKNA